MSYKAIFQLFLQIHDFQNIDLPCQGIFRIRASIFQEYALQKVYATPFQFMQQKKKILTDSKRIHFSQQIQPPYFYSKAAGVRYSDDKIVLDDLIRFKLQIESFPELNTDNIFIQFDLLFAQYSFHPSPSKQFQGEIVGNKKFKLQNLQNGLLNYCQGQFTGNYSSKFSFTLFGCLTNFKFGKYKISSQLQVLDKQDSQGNIRKFQVNKQNQNIRLIQLERSKVTTFQELIKWTEKHYNKKIQNPLSYFYHTYVKNLRLYFYNSQIKLNEKSIIVLNKILKVPKDYLQLSSSQSKEQETEVNEKQFRKFMTDYQPLKLSCNLIMQQTNNIYMDIYMFLLQVEKQFIYDQLMMNKMKTQYETYVKQRYGQRVFKSIVNNSDINVSSRENKKIAKKMRQKQKTLITVTYPIQDLSFIQAKDMLQFLFYQINIPKNLKSEQIKGNSKDINKLKDETEYSNKLQSSSNIIESQNKVLMEKNPKQIPQQTRRVQNNSSKNEQIIKNQQNNEKETIIQKQKQFTGSKQGDLQTQVKQGQVQKVIEDKKTQKQKDCQQQDDLDVYKNVCHQKGQVDSQVTQKSFQLQNNNQKSDEDYEAFKGISQIKLAQNKKKDSIIEQNEQKQLPQLKYEQKDMLVVLCHGFQGSSYDMTIILRRIKQMLPEASFLISRSNQGMTEGDIEQMGQRLAKQVQAYVQNYMDKQLVVLNFVGHSMGGIIARCSVKHLSKQYYNQFGFFCSLSSPHLGYLNGVDGMIKAGLWAIMKFKPIRSLIQLKMDDVKDLKKSFMYKLSKEGNLKRFRKVILFSSFEDSYVSWHSARICFHTKKESSLAKLQNQMVSNILGNQPIHRIDVNFNVKTKNLDSFIGRTAHINLIIQQSLFKIIASSIPQLFNLKQL